MTGRSLDPLLRPRSVAVVGASAQEGKAGHAMMRSLLTFPGPLYPVNARAADVLGHRAVPSVADLPEPVDLAVLVVPAEAVPGVLEDCGTRGVRSAVVCAGGFAESGPDGQVLQEQSAEIARRHGIRVLGPNTSGFVRPAADLAPNFMPAVGRLRPGPAAFVAQSGGMNLVLSFLAEGEGLGLSLGIGLGNALDVDLPEVLLDLADDDTTEVVGLHVEGARDGRALCAAVRALAARKPVVALKIGRHDVEEFARSHTGALAGSYPVARAALAQSGAVLVDDPTAMVDAMRALAGGRLRPGRRGVGVVTGQAGPGLVIADELAATGADVPPLTPETTTALAELLPALTHQSNPVDTGRPGDTFPAVLGVVARDPGVDVVVVHALDEPGALDPSTALGSAVGVRAVFATQGPADVIAATASDLAAIGVPTFGSPERAARAAAALVADAAASARIAAPVPVGPVPAVPAVVADGEAGAKALLSAAGIAVPRGVVCPDPAATHAALRELGGIVVLKVLDPALIHKTDVGAVRTGIRTAADLDDALASMAPLAPRCYLVEQQAEPGTELIVGTIRDPAFGPVLLLGVGGTHVELESAAGMRLLPMSHVDAAELVDSLPAAVLDGLRGGPALDRSALLDVLAKVQDLVVQGIVEELEINPLRCTPTGPVALDAVVTAGVTQQDDGRPVGAAVAGGH